VIATRSFSLQIGPVMPGMDHSVAYYSFKSGWDCRVQGYVSNWAMLEVQMMASDDGVSVFESVRPRLFGLAYRMLGSAAEAEDRMHGCGVL